MAKRLITFFSISSGIAAVDQLTKWLVLSFIPLDGGINVVPGLVNIVHARNPGAAFGIMSQHSSDFRWLFLLAVSVAALLVVLWLVLSSHDLSTGLLIGYSLFFGGAAGNLIDRARFGEVIDFLDVFVGQYHWPAFNVADSALCVGVGLFALCAIRDSGRR